MPVAVDTVDIPNGDPIGYRERDGGDVPVVLLHANLTSSKHFDVVFEAMDARYKLYAMDLRGFGNSSYETPIEGIGDLAADVAAFGDAVGLDSFHLVGWLTEGVVATAFAAAQPARVRRLVLVGDRDGDIARESAETTVEDIGDNAHLVVLSDCGHSPFIDDLDQLLEEVTRFLEQ